VTYTPTASREDVPSMMPDRAEKRSRTSASCDFTLLEVTVTIYLALRTNAIVVTAGRDRIPTRHPACDANRP
jgi:hypothetical protein